MTDKRFRNNRNFSKLRYLLSLESSHICNLMKKHIPGYSDLSRSRVKGWSRSLQSTKMVIMSDQDFDMMIQALCDEKTSKNK